jgi:hypothetical protein
LVRSVSHHPFATRLAPSCLAAVGLQQPRTTAYGRPTRLDFPHLRCSCVCVCVPPASCQPANHPCLGFTHLPTPSPPKGPTRCLRTLPSDPSANPGCGLSTILSCRRLGLIPPTPWQPAAHPACLTNPSQSSPPPSTLDKARRLARAARTARRSSDVLAEHALQYGNYLPGTISRRPMSVHGAVIRCASRITSGYVRLTSQSRLRVRRNTI